MCKKVILAHRRCFGNLWKHLTVHIRHLIADQVPDAKAIPFALIRRRDQLYARMACLRNFSFRGLACTDMTEYGQAFNPLKSANGVRDHVIAVYDDLAANLKQALMAQKNHGQFFGLITDDWETKNHCRFNGLHVTSSTCITPSPHMDAFLGLSRITKSATKELIFSLIKAKLIKFGLDIQDICGLTTDGGANMVAMGK